MPVRVAVREGVGLGVRVGVRVLVLVGVGVSPNLRTIGVGVDLTANLPGVGVALCLPKVLAVGVGISGKDERGPSGEASPTPTLSCTKIFTGGNADTVTAITTCLGGVAVGVGVAVPA